MRRIAAVLLPILACLMLAAPAAGSGTITGQIAGQTVTNDGLPHVIASVSFTAVSPVNVLAGQSLAGSSFTLLTDAAPTTYPTPGVVIVTAQDPTGNMFQVSVSYTGKSGSSFTGCTVTNTSGTGLTSVAGPAYPSITGTVVLNRTGTGTHPWLNTLTSATEFDVAIQSSADGGVTWNDEASATTFGGIISDRNGQINTLELSVGPINPVANAVRMLATVPVSSPSPVWVSGTATVLTR